ncbi:hypothetical protein T4D_2470, partial [Trichinella pseudospiralis]
LRRIGIQSQVLFKLHAPTVDDDSLLTQLNIRK